MTAISIEADHCDGFRKTITYISSGPTRAGNRIQARFRVLSGPTRAGKFYTQCVSLIEADIARYLAKPDLAGIFFHSILANGPNEDKEGWQKFAKPVLADMLRQSSKRAIREKNHSGIVSRKRVRESVLYAVRQGMSREEIYEIVDDCIVTSVMTA